MSKKDILIGLLNTDAKRVNDKISVSELNGLEITITGATGLIGLNLICALIYYNKHHAKQPIKINALSYREPTGIFKDIFKDENIVSITGDIKDMRFIEKIPLSDCIIHSAGYGQPGKFLDDKLGTIAINTSATINLANRLRENGRFLFLSSSEVYSGNTTNKNIEGDIGSTDPSHPRACYIEGKRAGEAIINILREKGVKAASARLALAYGPGIRSGDERVLNQFIQKALNGKINLLDKGDAMRSYGYISDVIIMLLNILIDNNFAVYNIGGKSVTSIRNLAIIIGEEVGVEVNIPDSEMHMHDAPQIVGLDLARVENEYGHNDYISFNQGIKNTIEWIKYNK